MTASSSADPHRHRRFPGWAIAHAVWLYHTFALSLRDVELTLTERGVDVSHETVRRWCASSAAPSPPGWRGAARREVMPRVAQRVGR